MSNQLEKIKELIDRRAAARLGGGEKAIAKQHEKGHWRVGQAHAGQAKFDFIVNSSALL